MGHFWSGQIDFKRLLSTVLVAVGCFACITAALYIYMISKEPKPFKPPTQQERTAAINDWQPFLRGTVFRKKGAGPMPCLKWAHHNEIQCGLWL